MNFVTKTFFSILYSLTFAVGCKSDKNMMSKDNLLPPKANIITHHHKIHDHIRIDPYYWLKDRENPEVVDYLERENDYYQKMTAPTKELQEWLFDEMKGRIKEDDSSVPYFYNEYWYITRYEKGKDYPIYTRKKETLEAEEEVLFDCNLMATDYDYFSLVGINVSPDNSKVAYALDTLSRRKYVIYVKDLSDGSLLKTNIKNTTGVSVWGADNKTLYYNRKNPETLRSEAVIKHDIQLPDQVDELVYAEVDETYSVYVSKSKSKEYIFISSFSTLTSEHWFLKADDHYLNFKIIQPRLVGLEYDIEHFGDHFYIHTNHQGAINFKMMRTLISKPEIENWETLLEHREQVLLEDFELFKDYWVLNERENGLSRLRIFSWDGKKDYFMPLKGETYNLFTSVNTEFNTSLLRYVFNSMTTPSSVIEFNMETKESKTLKEQEVLGGNFDKDNYVAKRLWAPAEDGTKVPISIVYHKDTELNAETPILQYAYGSYGSTVDPSFSTTRLTLLDRGFAFAIAHIRGGEYMGRQWYEDGKLLKKNNTFTDFVDCSKFLIKEGYTSADHLYAYGGSAGGLLMGVVINIDPELYNGIISAVPFVDVVTTMLDDSIPLTTSEYDEWGNPNEKKYYEYMLSYSPYDQVKEQKYPNILVTAGFHDSQVQYFEPAKWVAKLRTMKTDNNYLFLDTNMSAGHSGASGRFDGLKELAKKYAFLLDLEEQ